MCDQHDNRGCEVVDEKKQIIDYLEDEIKALKNEIEMKDLEIQGLINDIKGLRGGFMTIKEILTPSDMYEGN